MIRSTFVSEFTFGIQALFCQPALGHIICSETVTTISTCFTTTALSSHMDNILSLFTALQVYTFCYVWIDLSVQFLLISNIYHVALTLHVYFQCTPFSTLRTLTLHSPDDLQIFRTFDTQSSDPHCSTVRRCKKLWGWHVSTRGLI